jgi:hypothetical protein
MASTLPQRKFGVARGTITTEIEFARRRSVPRDGAHAIDRGIRI